MKNKTIGIITIFGNNYGNRLQNFALQEVLKQFAWRVYTIPVYDEPVRKQKIKYLCKRVFAFFNAKNVKITGWESFYFMINWYHKSASNLNPSDFNYFVAGSDQIWNPLFEYNSNREFLTFAHENQRVAYAASIGIDKLADDVKKEYQKKMDSIPYISVREQSAAEIVEQLTGRKVPVVLDPTLLLEKKQWEKIILKSKVPNNKRKYIFKYFLGKENEVYNRFIKKLAAEKDADIIDIMDSYNEYGPADFIYLIKNSIMVVTNSFHCCAFSIIFERDFYCFSRSVNKGTGDMSSRIKNLLEMFKLDDRYITLSNISSATTSSIDFSGISGKINEEREKSLNFLKKALLSEKKNGEN